MPVAENRSWLEVNRRCLDAELEALWQVVDTAVDGGPGASLPQLEHRETPPGGTALDRISERFGLTRFERAALLLMAGLDFAPATRQRAARIAPAAAWRLTFADLLVHLPEAHWSAFAPEAPLRRWRLISLGGALGESLCNRPITIAEAVLHYLNGLVQLDPRLTPYVEPLAEDPDLCDVFDREVQRISEAYVGALRQGVSTAVRLRCCDPAISEAVAGAVLTVVGTTAYRLDGERLGGASAEDGEELACIWGRDARLHELGLVVVRAPSAAGWLAGFETFMAHATGPVVVTAPIESPPNASQSLTFSLPALDVSHRVMLWRRALDGKWSNRSDETIEHVAFAFNLDAASIRELGRAAREDAGDLWDLARGRARGELGQLAERVDVQARLDDLVLPDDAMATLRTILVHVAERHKVLVRWGFAAVAAGRGTGVGALFTGESGTGKTLAAEALAGELGLDLYRVELNAIVSKYIGETEKNLERIFRAAEGSGAILLFDEADALFGKRSEVRDSHDRYANLEVSYLLQRMERFAGLAIMTTNLPDAIDDAFLRRIRFIVRFPLPGPAERLGIWRKVFPADTPVAALDYDRLSRLTVSGGMIRNVALHAAFLAAGGGEPIGPAHLLGAARAEFRKIGKPLNEAEVRGWVR